MDCTEVADGGSRSEAEEKVYSWLYTLAQADKDLVFEYVRSTERGMFKISRRLWHGFLIQYRNNNIFQKLSLSIKLSCKIDSSKDIGSVSTSAGKKEEGRVKELLPFVLYLKMVKDASQRESLTYKVSFISLKFPPPLK